MPLSLFRIPALGGLLCGALTAAATANAATLTVTTTNDSGLGSLRQALADSNNGDTIQFDAALNGHTINLASGELTIDKDITIDGPGADQLAVKKSSGAPDFRIFYVLGHTVTVRNLTIDGNGTLGAGLWSDHGNVTLDGCVIQGCLGSGGVRSYASLSEAAHLTVINSTIRNNQADVAGGGIYNQAAQFVHADLSIRNSIVSNNIVGSFGSASGGGIWNSGRMDVTNSIVSGNTCGGNGKKIPFGNGGGIANTGGAFMVIINCTVSDNATGLNGGGVYNIGFTELRNSTVSGNSASGINDLEGWGDGAGLYNGSSMTIFNSTLCNNNSTRSAGGVSNHASLVLVHSTLSDNNAIEGGNIANNNSATLQIGTTILKRIEGGSPNIFNAGTVTSRGYNLSSDNGSGLLTASGDQINTDPMLGPLQNNGGPTLTRQLLIGSPAIDTGDPAFGPPPEDDQRCPPYNRVFHGRIDIGAFEVQPIPVINISGSISYCSNPVPGPVPNVTVTLTGSAPDSTLSNGSGNYIFSSLLSGGNHTVTPTKAALASGSTGINTVDVIAVQRHFLNIGTPLAGCSLAAADVNGNGAVNTTDVIAIQRFSLGLSFGFANVGKYQFTPVSRSYWATINNQPAQNYDAMIFGDVVAPFVE